MVIKKSASRDVTNVEECNGRLTRHVVYFFKNDFQPLFYTTTTTASRRVMVSLKGERVMCDVILVCHKSNLLLT